MKIALITMNSGIDPAANCQFMVDHIAQMAGQGAEIISLPEICNLVDQDKQRASAHIYPQASDPTLRALTQAAAQWRVYIHVGSLVLRADGDRYANRSFVINPQGQIIAQYDKIHLFDVALPNGESYRESASFNAGSQVVVADCASVQLGLSICYDLRFPYLFRQLNHYGAQILMVPACFTKTTGTAHWEVLLRARAIENSCFVVAAAQLGRHEDGRETFGHSMIIDPWGSIIINSGSKIGGLIADIDLSLIDKIRAQIPAYSIKNTNY